MPAGEWPRTCLHTAFLAYSLAPLFTQAPILRTLNAQNIANIAWAFATLGVVHSRTAPSCAPPLLPPVPPALLPHSYCILPKDWCFVSGFGFGFQIRIWIPADAYGPRLPQQASSYSVVQTDGRRDQCLTTRTSTVGRYPLS